MIGIDDTSPKRYRHDPNWCNWLVKAGEGRFMDAKTENRVHVWFAVHVGRYSSWSTRPHIRPGYASCFQFVKAALILLRCNACSEPHWVCHALAFAQQPKSRHWCLLSSRHYQRACARHHCGLILKGGLCGRPIWAVCHSQLWADCPLYRLTFPITRAHSPASDSDGTTAPCGAAQCLLYGS